MTAPHGAGEVLRVLHGLERDGRSGVLRVGDVGSFEVAGGAVVHAECRYTAGEWAEPIALFDAACFLLGAEGAPRFAEGPVSRGAARPVTAATLACELRRRRDLLDAAWPSADVDAAPVVPVRRVRRQRVFLTGLQAEILLNADGRRTPAELARDLGRTVFGCLLSVRGLAAASLVRAVRPGASAEPAGPAGRREPSRDLFDCGTPRDGWAPADHQLLERLRAALVEL
ncbi:hypothetical protein [Actinomadura sp. WAC 06369]|uniref:hypothetical protein n=1 Tax=Actinomadura sp. WAC 06369 TaxID=2203193 RepID=UPI001F24A5CA|nr:hypothetical protein [Actinomadura sp. WAC 06369]